MKTNNKKGISLIVLVITIIVMIILAAAIILSLDNSGIIGRSNEAKFKNDVSSMQEKLEVLNAESLLNNDTAEITIDSIATSNDYKEKFAVQDEKLKFVRAKLTEEEIAWAEELGLKPYATLLVNGQNGVTITENGELVVDCDQFNLVDVKVPEEVKTIAMLYYCETLISIDIPDTVTRIAGGSNGAFLNCTNLKSINIPKGVTTLEERIFNRCSSLKSIVIPDTVTSFEDGAFAYSGVESITLPKGITTIKDSTFNYCYNLKSVIIPDSVTTIENRAFNDCRSLTSITIPKGVATVEEGAFTDCSGLKNIVIEGEPRYRFSDVEGWFTRAGSIYNGADLVKNVTITGSGYISE